MSWKLAFEILTLPVVGVQAQKLEKKKKLCQAG